MKNIKFSIITPYYNSLDFMENYFMCIENQTFKDFEVIIINDCSNDGKDYLLEQKLKQINVNFKILNTIRNSGPGIARNLGIENAIGEYIFFIDSDDYIEINSLEIIYNSLYMEVDCIIYNYFKSFKNRHIKESIWNNKKKVHIKKEYIIKNVNTSTLGKIYRRKLLVNNSIIFPNIYLAEDFYFTISAISTCNTFIVLEEHLYHYVIRKDSITNIKSYYNFNEIIESINKLLKNKIINFEEYKFFFLREYVYMTIVYEKGKKISKINQILDEYSLNDFIKNKVYFKIHHLFILILYKFKLYIILKLVLKIIYGR